MGTEAFARCKSPGAGRPGETRSSKFETRRKFKGRNDRKASKWGRCLFLSFELHYWPRFLRVSSFGFRNSRPTSAGRVPGAHALWESTARAIRGVAQAEVLVDLQQPLLHCHGRRDGTAKDGVAAEEPRRGGFDPPVGQLGRQPQIFLPSRRPLRDDRRIDHICQDLGDPACAQQGDPRGAPGGTEREMVLPKESPEIAENAGSVGSDVFFDSRGSRGPAATRAPWPPARRGDAADDSSASCRRDATRCARESAAAIPRGAATTAPMSRANSAVGPARRPRTRAPAGIRSNPSATPRHSRRSPEAGARAGAAPAVEMAIDSRDSRAPSREVGRAIRPSRARRPAAASGLICAACDGAPPPAAALPRDRDRIHAAARSTVRVWPAPSPPVPRPRVARDRGAPAAPAGGARCA